MGVEQGTGPDRDTGFSKTLPLVAMYFWMHQFFDL
jgi:hypothetical protein